MKVSSEAAWFRAWPSCGEIARGFPMMNIGEQREKSSTRALSAPELGRAPDHLALSLGQWDAAGAAHRGGECGAVVHE